MYLYLFFQQVFHILFYIVLFVFLPYRWNFAIMIITSYLMRSLSTRECPCNTRKLHKYIGIIVLECRRERWREKRDIDMNFVSYMWVQTLRHVSTSTNTIMYNQTIEFSIIVYLLLPCVSRDTSPLFVFLYDQRIPQFLLFFFFHLKRYRFERREYDVRLQRFYSVNSLNTHVTLLPCVNMHST